MDAQTDRLTLHLLSFAEIEALSRRQQRPGELWAPNYPSFEEVELFEAYLAQNKAWREQTSSMYQVKLRSSEMAIGLVGVMPSEQSELRELGFGVAHSFRKMGYATEAAKGVVELEKEHGAPGLFAIAPLGQQAAHRILSDCGFQEDRRDEDCTYYVTRF